MVDNYDHVVIIKNLEEYKNGKVSWKSLQSKIEDTFKNYLGKRLFGIELHAKSAKNNYLIGLYLNPDMIHLKTEKGPVYGTEEAVIFKNKWGDMSKVMHINGAVHECVVWPDDGNLLMKIINFIMEEKLGFKPHGKYSGWHQIYHEKLNIFTRRYPLSYHINKQVSPTIQEAYDVLSTTLIISTASQNFQKLAVHINDMRPIGAWSRYTNLFSEKAISIDGFKVDSSIDQINKVYYVGLMAEHNNKWPSDICALKMMKTLLMGKISKLLWTDKRIRSKVLNDGSIDVLVKGFVFRCVLVVKKELLVLKRQHMEPEFREVGKAKKRKHSSAVPSYIDRNEKLLNLPQPIREYMMRNDLVMEINAYIRCLGTQFGSVFKDTCRLAKRWFSSQCLELLDDSDQRILDLFLDSSDSNARRMTTDWCFTELACELIVSHVFLHPGSEYKSSPQSPVSGFLRFLKLLAHFDWTTRPLVVNLNGGFSENVMTEMEQPFKQSENRFSQLPSIVIRTPINTQGDHWTSAGPNAVCLQQTVDLARQAYECATFLLNDGSSILPVFQVDLERFDVLFHLKMHVYDLVIDQTVGVTKADVKHCLIEPRGKRKLETDKSSSEVEKRFQMWPKDYEDSPIDSAVAMIRTVIGQNGLCTVDRFGGRFIAVKWLKKTADKKLLTKMICCKGCNFIAKCEILK